MTSTMESDDCEDLARDDPTDRAAQTVLAVLLSRHPGVVALDELVRELSTGPEEHPLSDLAIRDGIGDLVGDGLAHRIDRFVIASHAAVRANVLIE